MHDVLEKERRTEREMSERYTRKNGGGKDRNKERRKGRNVCLFL
jgi:hypothetical protein